jgi:hypothetical protein
MNFRTTHKAVLNTPDIAFASRHLRRRPAAATTGDLAYQVSTNSRQRTSAPSAFDVPCSCVPPHCAASSRS